MTDDEGLTDALTARAAAAGYPMLDVWHRPLARACGAAPDGSGCSVATALARHREIVHAAP